MTDSIQLVAVDLDGTLLNSQHQISERSEKALKAASEQGVKIILATGKTRASAQSLIARLGLDTPGIYVQGLTIYNADGTLRHQTTLDPAVARQVITFAEERGFVVVAYSGSRMFVRRGTPQSNFLSKYGEPEPEVVGALQNVLHSTPINKLLAVSGPGSDRRINALRWQLNMQVSGAARMVQAGIPHMLEILPPGASKGTALRTLLKEFNIAASQVMAIGDGENDIEMIQLAGIGVAMANAPASVKAVAQQVVASNDEDGVAEAIERFVLKPIAETSPVEDEKNEVQS